MMSAGAVKKKDIVKEVKFTNITAAFLLALTGVIIMLFPSLENQALAWICGGILVLIGIAKFLGYFSNDLYRLAFQFDFAGGILAIVLGGLLFASPASSLEMLPYILGFYVILDGLLKIQIGLDARRFGINKWLIILLTAAALAVIGILAFVALYLKILTNAWIIGAILIGDGIENAWITMYTVKVRAAKKNAGVRFGIGDGGDE